jgi:prepilin-type N-terminal cleavage/methylation domain-containing protein
MRYRNKGFTLVELMIVVVILALLGVLAVNIYRRYIQKAKTSEAMTMLQHIRAKQEAYQAEHYRYAHVGAFWPTTVTKDQKTAFTPLPAEWQQLGIQATMKYVYFQYNTISDQGGQPPPNGIWTTAPAAWYVATAQAKFDDYSTPDTTFEMASDRDTVWKMDKFGNRGPP